MCLLIYKNAGVIIPEEHLEEAFDNNSHGAGFTVRVVNEAGQGYLHRERGFFKYQDFIEAYRPFAFNQGIVHFRLATAGLKNEENCHPFEVTRDFHMGHNGIISIAQSISKDHSDTWHYVEQVMKPVHRDLGDDKFFENTALHFLIGQSIGHSKLAFIHADGRHLIINEEAGHWNSKKEPTVWYSNDTYDRPRYKASGFGWGRHKESSFTPSSTASSCSSALPAHYQGRLSEDDEVWGDEETYVQIESVMVSKHEYKLLVRARKNLGSEDWMVKEALECGLTPREILDTTARKDGTSELFAVIYGDGCEMSSFAGAGTDYRTQGSSFAEEDFSPGHNK